MRESTTTTVKRARTRFERVARTTDSPLAQRVRDELERIARRDAAGDTDRHLGERARELAQMRAYVIRASEIADEGRRRVHELAEWGVPAEVTDRLETNWVPDLDSSDEGTARVALYTIYEQYDYWDWYVETYAGSRKKLRTAMLVTIAVAVLATAGLVYLDSVLAAIACAGIAAAIVGIVALAPRAITAFAMGGVDVDDIVAIPLPVRRRIARGSATFAR